MEFFKHLPIAALQVDSEGCILEINVRAHSLFGINEQLIGRKIYHYIPDQDISDFFVFFEELPDKPDLFFTTSLQLADNPGPVLVTLRGSAIGAGDRIFTIERCDPYGPGCGKRCHYSAALTAQFENNPGGILLVDANLKVITCNPSFRAMWNLSKNIQDSHNGEATFREICSKLNDSAPFLEKIRTTVTQPDTTVTGTLYLKDGRQLCLHSAPIDNSGSHLGRAWYFFDITGLETANRETEARKFLQNIILDHIQDGVIACDSEGNINLFNRSSQEFFGLTAFDEIPRSFADLKMYAQDGMEIKAEDSPLSAALAGKTVHDAEITTRTKAGFTHTLLVSGQPILDEENNRLGAAISLHNITDQKITQRQLHFLAYHDSLTGLPNRRLFHDLLSQSLKQAHRNDLQVGVLFLDLDNFKDVNDTHGHAVGDQVLMKVASCLNQRLRESDIICRWGGDEFVIGLLDSRGRKSILKVAEKLGQAVLNCLVLDDQARKISISIGIAIFPDHGPLPDRLIRNADVAMYRAKRKGKNRCEVFELT